MKPRVETHCETKSTEAANTAPSWAWVREVFPGLLRVGGLTTAAYALFLLPCIDLRSPMILPIALGTLFHSTVSMPARAKAGAQFALRRLLRIAIILLGLQPTIA